MYVVDSHVHRNKAASCPGHVIILTVVTVRIETASNGQTSNYGFVKIRNVHRERIELIRRKNPVNNSCDFVGRLVRTTAKKPTTVCSVLL